MLKKLLHSIIRKRHFWRDVKFDELAEIYTSMGIRGFGFGIIGIFVPIFLYQNDVSLQLIFLFYTWFFLFRIPIAFITAFLIGRVGPKHTIAISTLLTIVFLLQLLSFGEVRWPLAFMAFFYTLANGLFFIAYHTDFSKIKDSKNGGKELGWLFIFERAGGTLGPFVGGIAASLISPLFTIVVAIVALLGSLIPLFMSNEPVKTHQHISFKDFKWKNHMPDYISLSAFSVENFASIVIWPLLVGVTVFTDDTYAKLGILISVVTAISMFGARLYGKLIDNMKGLALLRIGTMINALIHLVRAFINTSSGVIAVSTLNEPNALSYRMSIMKGYYDVADTEKGHRIVYLVVTEMATATAKTLFCLGLLVSSYYFDPTSVLRNSFIFVAVISLGMLLQKFPALKNN